MASLAVVGSSDPTNAGDNEEDKERQKGRDSLRESSL